MALTYDRVSTNFLLMRQWQFVLACLILQLGLAPLGLSDDQPSEMQQAIQAGEAGYRKADYETARVSYEKAWQLVQGTAHDNPARYDILKKLTAILASLGRFEEADASLQLAMNW